jgi:eukaryotic-like serine/threonine-protein kinase
VERDDTQRSDDEWAEPTEVPLRPLDEEETVVERVEASRGAPPPPGSAPEAEQVVVRERETVRRREDGSVERDVVRNEERRRWSGDRIALVVLLALIALAAAGAALWYFTQEDTATVPSVTGLPVDRATAELDERGFDSDVVTEPNDADEGTVFAQDPGAGSDADEGSTVQLRVSGGPDTTAVPNAVGLQESDARDRLVDAGFQVETEDVFSERDSGSVVSQEPAAGAQAAEGATVTLSVSQGTGLVDVPNVVGLTRGQAQAELSSAKLEANVVEVPSDENPGTVVAQNPVGGQARQGSTVRLNVSAGR